MTKRFNRVPISIALAAIAAMIGGCGLLGGGDDISVRQVPETTTDPEPFPSPTVTQTAKPAIKVALTRPTDPDDRLKVIKSGRQDPFELLVDPPAPDNAQRSEPTSAPAARGPAPTPAAPAARSSAPASGNRNPLSGLPGALNLPKLPDLPEVPEEPPTPELTVTGIVNLDGENRAIVQAPGEPTSRTVSIGAPLSGGSLIVKDIDTSNPIEPVVIVQAGSRTYAVGIGREPVLVASSGPKPTIVSSAPMRLPAPR